MLNLAVSAGQKTAKWNKNPLDVMQPLEKQSYAVIHAQLNFISLYIWPGGGMRPNFQTGTGRIINQKDLMPEGFVAGLFLGRVMQAQMLYLEGMLPQFTLRDAVGK
jgi:hypothetical protein